MTDKLLPCPFCGGEADRITLQDEDNLNGDVITCTKCDACSRVVFGEKEGLIDAWNRRAKPVSPDDGEAVEVVAYLNTSSGEVVVYGPTVMDWDDEHEPVESLMTVAQHQRILAQRDAEVERLRVEVDRTYYQLGYEEARCRLQLAETEDLRTQLDRANALLNDMAPHFAAPFGMDELHHRIDAHLSQQAKPR